MPLLRIVRPIRGERGSTRYFSSFSSQRSGVGMPLSTGKQRKGVSFADEVHGTLKMVQDALALADCTLDDVIDSQVWLKDPRDFDEMNRIYATYFKRSKPIRSVFQNSFMLEFRIEIKVVAYKPQ